MVLDGIWDLHLGCSAHMIRFPHNTNSTSCTPTQPVAQQALVV